MDIGTGTGTGKSEQRTRTWMNHSTDSQPARQTDNDYLRGHVLPASHVLCAQRVLQRALSILRLRLLSHRPAFINMCDPRHTLRDPEIDGKSVR